MIDSTHVAFVRSRPKSLVLESVVSDTPVDPELVERRAQTFRLPSRECLEYLEQLDETKEPVTVSTPFKVYDNMVLESLDMPRDKNTGDALRFTATFRQIRVVKNTRRRVSIPRAAGKVNRGSVPGKQVNPPIEWNGEQSRVPDSVRNKLDTDSNAEALLGPDWREPAPAPNFSPRTTSFKGDGLP